MGRDYHKEIGFPDLEKPTGSFEVEPSYHARKESNSDRYGGFSLPTRIRLTENMYKRDPKEATGSEIGDETLPHVFEVTVENSEIVKVGARTNYDDERDIVLIIMPYENLLKTAWINVKGDAHHTLDESKYAKP